MADHRTPLIRNCWYVAGLGADFTRALRDRTLLGKSVLFYRTREGRPVAVQNRCIHRSFPLVKGTLEDDEVVCGYHGMRYDANGQCTAMPAMANVPANARIPSYPVVERGPLVWIWMGDPALADPASVPDLGWLDAPEWATVGGTFSLATNYVAMHENLLDQTHFAFLHIGTVGTKAYARSDLDVEAQGEAVIIKRSLLGSEPPAIYGVPMKLMGRPVNRYSDSRYASPALHVAHARIENPAPVGDERRDFRVNITHVFTPQRQNSIHYWWFASRDFDLHDKEVDTFLTINSEKAYLEDVDALTAIQAMYDQEPDDLAELSFAPDRPGIMMRRNLYRLAMAEGSVARAA